MATDLTHIKAGDKIATSLDRNGLSQSPHVRHQIWLVTKRTASQIVASNGYRELRVRASDGKVVGDNWSHAIEATHELIAQHNAERDLQSRYYRASLACDDIIGRPMHQLKLSVPQLEALAKAWAEIKAMVPQS